MLNVRRFSNSGGEPMGMSDKQFDSYKAQLLDNLRDALEEIKQDKDPKKLERLVNRLDAELKQP